MAEAAHGDKHALHRRIVARLREQTEDLRRIASGLDEAALARRISPEKWSLKELICHLWRVQQVFAGRVEAMLVEDNPRIEPYDPDQDAEFDKLVTRPTSESLAGFVADRERLAARFEELAPADWHRPGNHPEFPNYDVHFQIEYMGHHEAHHIYQMFQRRAPLGKVPH